MAGMSKRHFEGLAGILDRAGQEASDNVRAFEAVRGVAIAVADMCARENPQFDRARFLAACGLNRA